MATISGNLITAAESHGISKKELERQIALFVEGVPFIKLDRPATVGDGILKPDQHEIEDLMNKYKQSLSSLSVLKFVPASGAASRMFRDLEAMLNNHETISFEQLDSETTEAQFTKIFVENLQHFAFFAKLKEVLAKDNYSLEKLLHEGNFKPILDYTLTEKGLNYASMPKALIEFHSYNGESRNAMEEHFHESLLFAKNESGAVRIHFTISPEFEEKTRQEIDAIVSRLQTGAISFDVSLSFQQSSTDTIAVTPDNEPFKDDAGNFVFRPGGHGALLNNLNKLDADIVFIKNIDNIVPDYLKNITAKWKQVIGGYLVDLKENVHRFLNDIDAGSANYDEIKAFCRDKLKLLPPSVDDNPNDYYRNMLNRPIRVCGMVRNEGEPGGGPFWVHESNGRISLQIVESSQIDINNNTQKKILEQSTHFNPVDLVCLLTDYKGKPFVLDKFSNPKTAFIAEKSKDGKKLKALERPGLWNGAMENWITLFVEVPIETFNPVKTVNDLLRPQHQPEK